MKQIFEKWKTPIEVVAIVAGGAFAFFTWGVDQLSVRQPNWDVSVASVNAPTLEYQGAIGCAWEGEVVTENKGNRPLSVGETRIEFYLFDRPQIDDSVGEYTGFVYERRVTEERLTPFHRISICPLVDSLIFPGKKAQRPFSIIFENQKSVEDLEKVLKGQVMLVRVFQDLNVESVLGFPKFIEARINYFDPNIGGYGLNYPVVQTAVQNDNPPVEIDLRDYTLTLRKTDANEADN